MPRMPFGYEKKDGEVVPIENDLDQLHMVKDMIKTEAMSIREGADHLTAMCSRPITYEGLRRIINGKTN